jgi:hypothetical protein
MDEQRLVHPTYAELAPAGETPEETQWLDPAAQAWPRPRSQSSGASAIGSQSRGAALQISNCSVAEATGGYRSGAKPAYCGAFSSTEQQEQQLALLPVKTGIEVSSSSFRKRSLVTASKSLRSMALSLRPRPRNLSKIRIVSSVDDGSDNAVQEQHDLCCGSNTPPNDGAICAPTKSSERIGLRSQ